MGRPARASTDSEQVPRYLSHVLLHHLQSTHPSAQIHQRALIAIPAVDPVRSVYAATYAASSMPDSPLSSPSLFLSNRTRRHLPPLETPQQMELPLLEPRHKTAPPQYSLAVYMLSAPMDKLIPLYHNLVLRYEGLGPSTGPSQKYLGSSEFFSAHFAWSISKIVQGFLGTRQWVVIRSSFPQGQRSSTAGYEHNWASNGSLRSKASIRSLTKRPR